MSRYRKARVTDVFEWSEGIQEASIEFADGSAGPAIVLEELCGDVKTGDEVIANTTAVELQLGSGGYHFVLWNLSKSELDSKTHGHIMKMRYTPMQINVQAIEEQMSPGDGEFEMVGNALNGMPVVTGLLHSQLLSAVLAYQDKRPDGRMVYIMTDGGSLPLKFSRTVQFLKEKNYLSATITCGHAFGGDYEAVNIYGALVAAQKVCRASAVIALMGPGIVGTGTALGFSGMEQATVLNAASSLGGKPIAIPRITFQDSRDRHRGLSHHTLSVLLYGVCAPVHVPIPKMEQEKRNRVWSQIMDMGIDKMHDVREVESEGALELIGDCGYNPTVMGRTLVDEPEYFMASAAAGIMAAGV